MDDTKKQIVDVIKQANNILVTVKSDPSIDQLAACIALTLMINELGKHGTAVFSGVVPSVLEFLEPEKTIERNTDSLQDFIISLDKSKADKLRYKVEDTVVKIFITPYRTSISNKDLEFGQGDFNVDAVIALGVHNQDDLDQAITAHGRILHDATVVSINTVAGVSEDLGSINWVDAEASSLSEMISGISTMLGKDNLVDNQVATALLTGIVAETERFGNAKTSPHTMEVSAQLLMAGANQELVATKLSEPAPQPIAAPVERYEDHSADTQQVSDELQAAPEAPAAPVDPNMLEISHDSGENRPGQDNFDLQSAANALNISAPEPVQPDTGNSNADDGLLDTPSLSGSQQPQDGGDDGQMPQLDMPAEGQQQPPQDQQDQSPHTDQNQPPTDTSPFFDDSTTSEGADNGQPVNSDDNQSGEAPRDQEVSQPQDGMTPPVFDAPQPVTDQATPTPVEQPVTETPQQPVPDIQQPTEPQAMPAPQGPSPEELARAEAERQKAAAEQSQAEEAAALELLKERKVEMDDRAKIQPLRSEGQFLGEEPKIKLKDAKPLSVDEKHAAEMLDSTKFALTPPSMGAALNSTEEDKGSADAGVLDAPTASMAAPVENDTPLLSHSAPGREKTIPVPTTAAEPAKQDDASALIEPAMQQSTAAAPQVAPSVTPQYKPDIPGAQDTLIAPAFDPTAAPQAPASPAPGDSLAALEKRVDSPHIAEETLIDPLVGSATQTAPMDMPLPSAAPAAPQAPAPATPAGPLAPPPPVPPPMVPPIPQQ